MNRWALWFVVYRTCADVAREGDIKPRLIVANLSWPDANKMLAETVGRLGYCIKPWERPPS